MTTAMSLGLLFIAKMADNALSTVKTIMIQRNRSLLAGVAIALSSFLYFWITRSVVLADSLLTTMTVAVASGFGCFLVSRINNKLSKDRTYVNVVMSDDMAAMQDFRDYQAPYYKRCFGQLYAGLESQDADRNSICRNQGAEPNHQFIYGELGYQI